MFGLFVFDNDTAWIIMVQADHSKKPENEEYIW